MSALSRVAFALPGRWADSGRLSDVDALASSEAATTPARRERLVNELAAVREWARQRRAAAHYLLIDAAAVAAIAEIRVDRVGHASPAAWSSLTEAGAHATDGVHLNDVGTLRTDAGHLAAYACDVVAGAETSLPRLVARFRGWIFGVPERGAATLIEITTPYLERDEEIRRAGFQSLRTAITRDLEAS